MQIISYLLEIPGWLKTKVFASKMTNKLQPHLQWGLLILAVTGSTYFLIGKNAPVIPMEASAPVTLGTYSIQKFRKVDNCILGLKRQSYIYCRSSRSNIPLLTMRQLLFLCRKIRNSKWNRYCFLLQARGSYQTVSDTVIIPEFLRKIHFSSHI